MPQTETITIEDIANGDLILTHHEDAEGWILGTVAYQRGGIIAVQDHRTHATIRLREGLFGVITRVR
jgi:hypothetical protein